MVTFETVRRLFLALPGVEEATSYGTPSFKVRGTFLARLREEGVLVVKVGPGDQEALTTIEPDVYFITPHYAGSNMVLVRLDAIEEAALGRLLTESWRLHAPRRLVAAQTP